jgi:hypothetical protein
MLKVSAEIKEEDIKNLLQNFSGSLVRKAVRSALDRTATWGKKYLVNVVAENYNIEPAHVRKSIMVKRTTQTNLEVSFFIWGKPLSILHYFDAIQDAVGISANISKFSTFRVPHAFINVNRKAGGRFMAVRVGKSRYPTSGKPDRGPSIPILINRLAIRDKRDLDLTNHLYKELEEQISKRTMGLPTAAEFE